MVEERVTDVLGPIAEYTVTPKLDQTRIVPFYQTEEGRLRADTVRRLYRKGLIPDTALLAQLISLEYSDSLARSMLENEFSRKAEVEREPEVREISRANLKSFYTLGIIDEETWRHEMGSLDYPEKYIQWFFTEMTVPE